MWIEERHICSRDEDVFEMGDLLLFCYLLQATS